MAAWRSYQASSADGSGASSTRPPPAPSSGPPLFYPMDRPPFYRVEAVNKPRPCQGSPNSRGVHGGPSRSRLCSTDFVTRWGDICRRRDAPRTAYPFKLRPPSRGPGDPAEPSTLVRRVRSPLAIEIHHQSGGDPGGCSIASSAGRRGRSLSGSPPLSRPQSQAVPPELDAAMRRASNPTLNSAVTDMGSAHALGAPWAPLKIGRRGTRT